MGENALNAVKNCQLGSILLRQAKFGVDVEEYQRLVFIKAIVAGSLDTYL
jgi:hypothetical protein